MYLKIYLPFFLYLSSSVVFAQDSLSYKSYEELFDSFYSTEEIRLKEAYTNTIIKKAKKDKDTSVLLGGYYLKSYLYKDRRVILYSDSIIRLKKDNSDINYPASSYIAKGIYYHDNRKLKLALDNYLQALDYAKKHSNKDFIVRINYSIGVLKYLLGDGKEALKLFKNNLLYFKKNKEDYPTDYLNSIFSMAVIYNDLKKLDSANYYNNFGYKESNSIQNNSYNSYFRLNDGITKYLKGDYHKALSLLEKSISPLKDIEDDPNLTMAYFYIGQTYDKLGNQERALSNFKKVDTLYRNTRQAHPRFKEAYKYLVKYFDKKGNLKMQSNYLGRLIELDSVLHDNEIYLNKGIVKKYDIPILISERNQIIKKIKKQDSIKRLFIIGLVLVLVFLIMAYYYQYRKKQLYKKRFLNIINSDKTGTDKKDSQLKLSKENAPLTIPNETVEMILLGLEKFEQKELFLNSDITITILAKKIKTNAKYLSLIIKYHKNKTFINYLNDLRVNYIINRLKNEPNYRKYTLLAISNEVGFKKTESFSRAFQKVTGITPSFFIKELNTN
ncbi:AraC family transcriptional regulator [Aquimarina aggregata]|uniref:AraC family transcriptional regulator n=1 Tax=Aquimarina aggregata TaxID=1642818 RepID=UPI0024902DD6|nr:AraC family transcriptional regulator [Aquimarina aggregata]